MHNKTETDVALQKRLKLAFVMMALLATAATIAVFPAGAVDALGVTEVAPGVFVHRGAYEDVNPNNRGDIPNIGFIVGEKGVAVIDTGNTLALGQALRAAVKARTGLPALYVINTHGHPDHVFGNAAFKDDKPQFVGHEKP